MTDIKQTKAEKTRELLLELALKEFRKNGFDQATMRSLALAADLSLGAFYYHFESKDDLVHAFYERSVREFAEEARESFLKEKSFEKRLAATVVSHLKRFTPDREIVIALTRSAIDPNSSISPFTSGTSSAREEAVAIMQELINSSDLKFDERLKPYLARLLWYYLMAFVLMWTFDTTHGQQKTYKIVNQLTPLIGRLIRLSRVPLSGYVIKPILKTLETAFEGEPEPEVQATAPTKPKTRKQKK